MRPQSRLVSLLLPVWPPLFSPTLDASMDILKIWPCTLVDRGSAKARLPHSAFANSGLFATGPLRLGELALVYLFNNPDRVFICNAWPSETSESCSIDTLIHLPVPAGSPICNYSHNDSSEAVIFKISDFSLFQLSSVASSAPLKVEDAKEVKVRFFGNAMKNSHTNTKRLQVKALLESKHVVSGAKVSRDDSGGFEIVSTTPFSNSGLSSSTSSIDSSSSLTSSTSLVRVTGYTTIHFVSLAETLKQSISLESKLDKVGGMARAKEALIEMLCLPLKYKHVLETLGTTVPRGILLHGPPGVGKTLLVKEAARSLGIPVLSVAASDVYSAVLGQSEATLRQIFDKAESMMLTGGSSANAEDFLNSTSQSSNSTERRSGSNENANSQGSDDRTPLSSTRLDRYTAGGHNAGGVVIFIDEIDAICSKRDGDGGSSGGAQQLEARIVTQLLTLLEQTRAIVVAATNRPNSLDPALRRPGRFDREISIGLPTQSERVEILESLLQAVSLNLNESPSTDSGISIDEKKRVLILDLASKTQSWSGADLSSLIREAALSALRTAFIEDPESIMHDTTLDPAAKVGQEVEVRGIGKDDWEAALCRVRPTSHRGWTLEVPTTKWDDIGGLEEVKKQLRMLVEWPIAHAASFKRLGLELPRGILLHGPPGCAKTTLVRAVAHACKASFVCLSGADVYSPLLGEAERKIREVFKKARAARPSIIFFDEIDAMVTKRGSESDAVSTRVLTQLLTEMDGVEAIAPSETGNDHLLVIAATNRPDQLDSALLRPGRFDRIVEIPLPDEVTRNAITKVHTRKLPLAPLDEVESAISKVAKVTNGCNGADLEAICREAGILALKADIDCQTVSVDFLIKAAISHTNGGVPSSAAPESASEANTAP